MTIEIKSERGHYVLYVNGAFYGSYDTMKEASDDVETAKKEREVA